nr:MAG TPA: hypothetical protein [Caudoviricetes sp.]
MCQLFTMGVFGLLAHQLQLAGEEFFGIQHFAGLFLVVHAVFPPSSSTSSLSTDTLKYLATFISWLMLGP